MDTTLGKIIGLVAVVALALPASAAAEPFDAMAEADYAAALSYWGQQPTSCLSVERELVAVLPGEAGDALGEATQPNPGEPPIACNIWIRTGLTPCAEKGTIYHEVGHVLGYGHSTNPNSIMYPTNGELFCEQEAKARVLAEITRELRVALHGLRRERIRCQHRRYPSCRYWLRTLRVEAAERSRALASLHNSP